MLAYIYTANGVSVLVNGVSTTMAKDDPRFEYLVAALSEGRLPFESEYEYKMRIEALVATPKQLLLNVIDEARLSDKLTIVGDVVYYQSYPVNNTFTRRLLDHIKNGVDIKPMIPFFDNLMQNPSNRTVEHLYAFLEYGKIPLTGDGCFLAYKAVRSDWKDIYSGTLDNSIGKVVEVPRNQVDEDPERTCSHGLHVCSFEYLPSFAHADGHVVIVKVNPKDVVAIPRDYNNTKMRVSRYEVVGEVEGYYDQRKDVLGGVYVDTTYDAPEPEPEPADPEIYVYGYETGEYEYEDYRSGLFADWDEAVDHAKSILGEYPRVVVTDEIEDRSVTLTMFD